MTDLAHPFPVGLRVRNYGQQYPGAFQGTATIVEVTPAGRGFEYGVLTDSPRMKREWAYDATIPGAFDRDFAHDLEALQPGDNAGCSCGFVGDEALAAAHARAYDMCGECWGGGTDAYPSLGFCPACGGSGTKADEDRMREVYDAAEREIDETFAAQAAAATTEE